MTRSVSPTSTVRISTCIIAFVVAFAMLGVAAPPAHAAKATAGSGVTKAVYTYDKSAGTAVYKKCKAKGTKATVPATITIKGVKYKVNGIASKAFAKAKVKTLTVATKKLAKARVKNALKKSKVTTVKVKVGTTPANNKYTTKYKKYFTKANAGKKPAVKTVKVKATAAQKLAIAKDFAKAYYTRWTFKNNTFSFVDAEKAIAPYLTSGCARNETPFDAAPFYQSATVTAEPNGLYIAQVKAYYTQSEATKATWNKVSLTTELRFTLNKYGLVTSIVS